MGIRLLELKQGSFPMGTVGLSFGSPTSGTGFDVSSTVSAIVANLQNVETPWKTQLSSLEAQDSTISSLGTLFSSLSNDMSALTDFQGILAEKTGSSSDTNVVQITAANASAVAGTYSVEVNNLAQTSSGYLAQISNANQTLSGSVTLAVGGGKSVTLTLNSSDNTLSGLAAAINASGVGITANVLTDSSGSLLSLASGTSGAGGDIVVSANSITAATANTLAYSGTAGSATVNSTGTLEPVSTTSDTLSGSISIQVGTGAAQVITLTSSDNTLTGLMNAINATTGIGVTASIVTNSDGTSSLALASDTAGSAGTLTVNSSISDSATALDYTSAVAGKDASLVVDGVNLTSASNTVANIIPGITLQLLAPSSSGEQVQVVIGNDNTAVESTVNQFVTDYNSLISAINAQDGNTSSGTPEPLFGSPTMSLLQQQLLGGLNTSNPNGTLTPVSTSAGATLSGSISITVGSGTAQKITLTSSDNTLSGLASAINAANIGVTASIVTSGGQSTLSLLSQTEGQSGGLSVSSSIVASAPTPLYYSDTGGYTSTTADFGTLTAVASAGDTLTGAVTIKLPSGAIQTITLTSSDNTLSGLASAINAANLGVTASLNSAAVGSNAAGTVLTLTSATVGSAGAMTVTSTVGDISAPTTTALNYTNSSDLNNLTGLGISVNNNGSLTFDAASLDSVLNSDYSSVVGFFQNSNGWGQSFSTMLTNSGSTAGTGILSLASTSNSNIESTLNADISKEQTYISAEQTSLTAELNSANEIMQQLPSQLDGVNELYSAITGYNQNSN
jgi:flagellar hook-associated protein 2